MDLINIIAGLATIAGFIVSIVQTVRYRNSQKELEQAKRARNASIWLNITMVLNTYETIDDAKKQALDYDNPHQKELLFAKICSARRSIVNQYLHLLKEAVLDEDDFTEDVVQEWKRIGRLENEWRVAQAMKFVRVKPPLKNEEKKPVL